MTGPPDPPATTSSSRLAENRLAGESSPYLRLHRHNPVDWYPWGEEALARARMEDRPIFLSVGYSTCYWCHVMERESFSDPAIAERMNRAFVNVKVDREERPDLDEVYMTATQILTGQGGWPNSVFLTPELEPFYAGTYFPPEDRHGRPGFPTLLAGLAAAWAERRDEVRQQAEELTAAMRRFLEERAEPGSEPPAPEAAEAALGSLARRFDAEHGGFGGAPKFPTPSNLFFLLDAAGRGTAADPGDPGDSDDTDDTGDTGDMLAATLDAMARGGIHDQLAGGFHRYATDRAWRVPHFEKMLYDNALLLELYAREHRRTGDPETARAARRTAAFLAAEMTTAEGAFASAIDAETGGEEGAYYVWTRDELLQVLGEEDFAFLAPLFGFAGDPFFEGGRYVLHLPRRLDAVAAERRTSHEALLAEIEPLRRRLLAARGERPRPATDDKVLADWNGMAIGGLATAGRLLGEPGMVEQAVRAADFVLAEMHGGAGLTHVWRDGRARVPAMLADYAWLVRGLLALGRAADAGEGAGEADRWRGAAAELADEMIARLADPRGGFYVAAERADLLLRSKDLFDGAVPSAQAVAVLGLLELARVTGERRFREHAERTLNAAGPLAEQFPDGARTLLVAARRWRDAETAAAPAPGRRGASAAGDAAAAARPLAPADGEISKSMPTTVPAAGERPGASVPTGAFAEAERQAREALTLAAEIGAVGEGGWRPFRLRLSFAPGWHAQPPQVADPDLVPTALAAESAELRAIDWPPPVPQTLGDRRIEVYRGELEVAGELRPVGRGPVRLLLTYQPCDERRCLPPVTRTIELG